MIGNKGATCRFRLLCNPALSFAGCSQAGNRAVLATVHNLEHEIVTRLRQADEAPFRSRENSNSTASYGYFVFGPSSAKQPSPTSDQ